MATYQSALEEIQQLNDLRILAGTYEAIAASYMQRIRISVLETRKFSQGLNAIFREVASAYQTEIVRLMKKKKIQDRSRLSLQAKNGKTILVFLSANTGLYGDIVYKTFSRFLAAWRVAKGDSLIIGRVGRALFEEAAPRAKFLYEEFPDNIVDVERLQAIIRRLSAYERVVMFHGEFKTLVTQTSQETVVSGSELPAASLEAEHTRYLFEPSLEVIMMFFETEIFSGLVTQTVQESRLAKLASRLVLLDKATVHIGEEVKKTKLHAQQLRHQILNKKQLEISNSQIFYA